MMLYTICVDNTCFTITEKHPVRLVISFKFKLKNNDDSILRYLLCYTRTF